MAQNEEAPRYFWHSHELTEPQYRAAKSLGTDDIFVETLRHRRTDDFIRKGLEGNDV